MMKNFLIYIMAAAAIVLGSCSDENKLDDSHFVSFALTVGSTTYPASIADNVITVSAPKDVDLSHAKVTYQLSEKATVIPDPSSIDNWGEDQAFRVESQSGSYVSYRYTTDRTDNLEAGSVVLATQTDVNNFKAKNVTRIAGSLVIGSAAATNDSIKNLDGLKSVTSIGYNVVVNSSFAGSDLEGLSNLKRANGIYVGSEHTRLDLKQKLSVSLPSLERVNNIIIRSDSVATVSLPLVTAANKVYINSIKLNDLNLSAFATCYGDFTLKGMTNNTYSSNESNLVLATLSLPALKQVYGTLRVEDFWNISKFEVPLLEEVDGDLQLLYVRGTPKIALPSLTKVIGNTNIQANDGMTFFSAPKLVQTSSLYLASVNNYSINLKRVDLSALKEVTGNLTVQFGGFTNLEFPALQTVGGKLYLNANDYMETLSMPELSKCPNLTMAACTRLTGVALDKLSEVSTLQFDNITNMQKLSLKTLQTIDNLTLRYSVNFTTFDMPQLKTINKALTFYGGRTASQTRYSATENIDGLAALTKVGKVDIMNCGKLTDFSGLKNAMSSLTASTWSVRNCKYNPSYQNMVDGKYKAE
jgi:hypothetical protein